MKKLIKPARNELQVRKPDGILLDPAGESLNADAWWYRRQAEGDVHITDLPVTAATQKKKRNTGEQQP